MPRLKNVANKSQQEVKSSESYCRVCKKILSSSKFYEATNPMIDKNGWMSICKDHCNEIYNSYFSIYNNIEKALYLTCQDLDVMFSNEALKQTQSHIEGLLGKGKKADAVFGYYKSKLGSTGKNNANITSFRFKDSDSIVDSQNNDIISESYEEDIDKDLELFWGKGFSLDDIVFLESELTNWKKTHKCENQAEITLLKEICIKILTIRNKRVEKKDTAQDVKELQELFKTASVDPAKANAISTGQSVDRFGVWIKDIEQYKPAEWWEQQEKYKDMDGFIPYIKNYIVRPIKNFFTGIKDFMIDGEDLSFKENKDDIKDE